MVTLLVQEKLRSNKTATLLYTFKSPDALAEVGWKVLVFWELGRATKKTDLGA